MTPVGSSWEVPAFHPILTSVESSSPLSELACSAESLCGFSVFQGNVVFVEIMRLLPERLPERLPEGPPPTRQNARVEVRPSMNMHALRKNMLAFMQRSAIASGGKIVI